MCKTHNIEPGVGTYWPIGLHLLGGGLASFGKAHAEAIYLSDGELRLFRTQRSLHQFDAHYMRYSAEAYPTWKPAAWGSIGLAYRLVQLRLADVTDVGIPVQLRWSS